MNSTTAADDLQNRAVLWSIGELDGPGIVGAACDALVAGLDTPGLRRLAACSRDEAPYDVPVLLPEALGELGLTYHPPGGETGREAVARTLARRLLTGELSPRDLADRIHRRFGHGLDLAEPLAALADDYGILGYTDRTEAEIDADVLAEARRLVEGG
ncbi:hypothetical protein ACWEQL_32925 [Kitasatospora sp. NPDC004240]